MLEEGLARLPEEGTWPGSIVQDLHYRLARRRDCRNVCKELGLFFQGATL